MVKGLQQASGFPEDQLKTVLCMLAAYPLGFLFKVCFLTLEKGEMVLTYLSKYS